MLSSRRSFSVRPNGGFDVPTWEDAFARSSGPDRRRPPLRGDLGLDRFEHGASRAGSGWSIVGEVDPLRCGRAPGASTYIRQLRDGLPQSCMHSTDDRGDGFTLFAGVETPIVFSTTRHPASGTSGSKAQRKVDLSGRGSWFSDNNSLGNEAGLDIAPERDRELAGQGDQHDAPDPARLAARLLDVPLRERAGGLIFPP